MREMLSLHRVERYWPAQKAISWLFDAMLLAPLGRKATFRKEMAGSGGLTRFLLFFRFF